MTKRIFRSICMIAVTVLLVALILLFNVLYEYFSIIQQRELQDELVFAAKGVENDGIVYLNSLSHTSARITWISHDGKVLYDTVIDPDGMEDHNEREEIREAFETGYGESIRFSASLLSRQLYVAERLEDGSVLRLSSPQASVLVLFKDLIIPILFILLGAVLMSFFLSLGVSRKIAGLLNELDADNLEQISEYEELKPLYHSITAQKKRLANQEATLRQKEDQFTAATEGMSEGILLIGKKRVILSINTAALSFFDVEKDAVGRDICAIDPHYHLETLLEEAETEHYAERIYKKGDSFYQLIANPIISEGKTIGLCVIILDTTEKTKNEALRREFTANVSHELKTPLHAISGYAELLSSGLVREEDVPGFLNQIHAESGRMIRLIEDIIRLSSLDEGESESGKTPLDLFASVSLSVDSLRERAEKANISLTLSGESVTLVAIPTLINAITENLVTNAIKYNRPGGSVRITVGQDDKNAILTVEDNGIGIAKEHHDRLFERFYRVDKSHSKAVGGTGLGLSIVKHAVRLHRGTIRLDSEPGVGTKVTVTLPK
ncbi:MAG: PAS domain-containing sensor histidine kinase [Clostridia bacterium]|nr:PAS domain-containing sensor histidine kinase [Clostridia bacterium]